MDLSTFSLTAKVVDIAARRVFPAKVAVEEGRIASIVEIDRSADTFLLPGFVDAHVHIESSMLVPSEFARRAVVHGTVATVSDPHEIGNVLGVSGVDYMQRNGAEVPFKFYFGAPSCVPATAFETAGAEISVAEVEQLLDDPRIVYLSEMMNFPGVLNGDQDVMAKLKAAHDRGKPVDGHAPGLRGNEARAYLAAGITTDHECFSKEEALDKLAVGCKIAIREGSAARNFDALFTLIDEHPNMVMLCSDDKHPDELLTGHINTLVGRAVGRGIDLFHVLRAASINPVTHYGLDVGLLREGDRADFIEVDSLDSFHVMRTWIDGQLVAQDGQTTIPRIEPAVVNRFVPSFVIPEDLRVPATASQLQVIEAVDGQLITNRLTAEAKIEDGCCVSDPDRDILKLVVANRYRKAPPAVAFIKNMGLKHGAMASSVAHDSHNVIAVGACDIDLCAAINRVIDARGGLSAVCGIRTEVLPLPIAGLMATGTCEDVGAAYAKLDRMVKDMGSPLRAPYMTLSFMALLVIPEIKLSDQGLFDGAAFQFLPLQ